MRLLIYSDCRKKQGELTNCMLIIMPLLNKNQLNLGRLNKLVMKHGTCNYGKDKCTTASRTCMQALVVFK